MSYSTPPSQTKARRQERWDDLVKRYGWVRAARYFVLGGEPKPHGVDPLQEKEKPLPGYVVSIIYVLSFAAGIVTGSPDLVNAGKSWGHKDYIGAGIALALFAVLLVIVYAIDRSLARTLPRLKLLFARRNWVVAIESLLFVGAVGVVEISTLFTLLQHESDISLILQGHPIIDPRSYLATSFEWGRAVMAFWTLIHSYLINEDLPPTLSTAKREGAMLFGGVLMLLIRHAHHVKGLKPGDVMSNFVLFLSQEPKAAWHWPWHRKADDKGNKLPYDRRLEQLALDKGHRDELVKALDALYPGGIPESISQQIARIEGFELLASPSESTPNVVGGAGAKGGAFGGAQNNAKGGQGPGGSPTAYNANSDYSRYQLPPGVDLTTTRPLAEMAAVFGLGAGTLSDAFNLSGLTPYQPMKGQPKNTKNLQAWQVLALADCGKLKLSSDFVREEVGATA